MNKIPLKTPNQNQNMMFFNRSDQRINDHFVSVLKPLKLDKFLTDLIKMS